MTDWEITQAMIVYGGGFVSALGELWRRGDAHNQERLKATFADYWELYEEIASQRRESLKAMR